MLLIIHINDKWKSYLIWIDCKEHTWKQSIAGKIFSKCAKIGLSILRNPQQSANQFLEC